MNNTFNTISNNHLYKQFVSNENKGLIWSLLTENDAFTNIPEHKASIVKDIFDKSINNIANKINPSDNLINLNKVIISSMMVEVKNHKIGKMDNIYNVSELSQQRQKMFEDELSNKQMEFDKLNNIPVPDKIDFSDNLDSPIGSEMNKILQEQIELREKQLNNVLSNQDKDDAKKWINTTTQNDENNDENNNGEQRKLKIGENINLNVNEFTKQKKKVNFEDVKPLTNDSNYSNDSNDFMALLKRKKPVTENIKEPSPSPAPAPAPAPSPAPIHEMLKEILDKQNQILDLLNLNKYIGY